MKLLLDTHLLLWAAADSPRLPSAARKLITAAGNDLVFSAASVWEVSIKQSLGDLAVDPHLLRRGLLDNGYTELSINSEHAAAVNLLPPIHKDPFDRILIAQATVEGITLLTTDKAVSKYPGPVRRV